LKCFNLCQLGKLVRENESIVKKPSAPGPATNLIAATRDKLLREASEAWGRQDYQKSIGLIEQASRKEPSNQALLFDLARAHGLRYEFAAAERCLEEAVKVSSDSAHTLAYAGLVCLEFEGVDLGIRYLEKASQKKGVTVGALMTLSDIYIRDGRVEDAANLIALAERSDSRDVRVLLEQALLRRLQGQSEEALSLLRSLLSKPELDAAVKIRGLYEMAGILDRQGQYEEAMSTLLEAKAVQRTQVAPFAATLELIQSRAREMEQSITAGLLARWRAEAGKLQPPRRIALLCGHPRAGTTLLEQVLDAHSDIITSEETRIMHEEAYLPLIRDFPEGTTVLQALDAAPPSLLLHARENYFRCAEMFLQKSIGGHLLVDKNPALNVMIPMVVRVFPEVKLLVAVRDPRDVVISCFLQALPLTPISSAYLSLEGTVKEYASAMGFWLDMRPRLPEQWLEVRYEELTADLPRVARSTLSFLGVEFEQNVLKFHEHARTKRVKSPSHAEVLQPVYQTAVGRWRNYQKYLEPYLPGLERFLKAFDYA
jgi:tetratricopeptide (TPR) repeat protein